jgi:putative cardiolipin synthase
MYTQCCGWIADAEGWLSLASFKRPYDADEDMKTAQRVKIPFTFSVSVVTAAALLLVAGCAGPGIKKDIGQAEPDFASAPTTSGPLAELARDIENIHGAGTSGFRLLDSSPDGLEWRLALIDSATSSLDVMTYLWYPDVSGKLLLERVVLAAQRGVRVRLVVDDLLTIRLDQLLVDLNNQPNIELRLFNSWQNRGMIARAGEMIAEMERLNTRMHAKLLVADGRAAIVGGRNIGDHYFGLSHTYNFHDLDVLAVGPIAEQASAMYDHYWNSDWIVAADNLTTAPDSVEAQEKWAEIRASTRTAPELETVPREPRDWTTEIASLVTELRPGTGSLVYDELATDEVSQSMIGTMFSLFERAQQELLITNAYIIPGEPAIDFLERLDERGVDIRILTNSLASHDVPAVNSHYEKWRDDLINAGVKLYELRADPAIQSLVDVPPVSGEFTGLHTKAAVIDGRYSFIGSMNLDPRSANINTEMGAIIDSPALASDLRAMMLRDMLGENAWRVRLDEDGDLYWVNSDETLDSQPKRNAAQDIMNVIFKVVPREQY